MTILLIYTKKENSSVYLAWNRKKQVNRSSRLTCFLVYLLLDSYFSTHHSYTHIALSNKVKECSLFNYSVSYPRAISALDATYTQIGIEDPWLMAHI